MANYYPSRPNSTRKNVVIIMSDEQRVDTLGAYGNTVAKTPHIDDLASKGTRFDRCYTPYSLCCPARASLWSGMMPHNNHVLANWLHIKPILRDGGMIQDVTDAGYHTIYTGKWHVPGTTPERLGFIRSSAIPDVIDGRDRGRYITGYRDYATALGYNIDPDDLENLTYNEQKLILPNSNILCGASEISFDHHLETWQTRKFLEQLELTPADKPFFAVCSYNAPHFPMIVPKPYDTLINPDDVILPENFDVGLEGKPAELFASKHYTKSKHLTEGDWRKLISHYWGFCSLIDAQVGRIIEWLKSSGAYEDTIIVFLSDHGDMIGSHGLNLKGFEVQYEETNRVPLIISHPDDRHESSRSMFVSLIDLIPTLADFCGVNINANIDGTTFAEVMGSSSYDHFRDFIITEAFHSPRQSQGEYENPENYTTDTWRPMNICIRTDQDKYIFHGKDLDEYYDLVRDPGENTNLYSDGVHKPRIKELQNLIINELEEKAPKLAHIVAEKML